MVCFCSKLFSYWTSVPVILLIAVYAYLMYSPLPVSDYKLYYFPGRGRAEVLRMLFAAADVKFQDIRVTKDEWPAQKHKMPFKQMPVLEIDGKMYAQSKAIANYLADQFGFGGRSNIERLHIDQTVEALSDVYEGASKVRFMPEGKEKEEAKKKFKEENLLHHLKILNDMAPDTGHFVGDRLTMADIFFYHILDMSHRLLHNKWLTEHDPKIDSTAKKFPNLRKIKDNVETHPTLGKWIHERPHSQM